MRGKKATHICSRAEGSVLGPETVQEPVPKSDCVDSPRKLNSGTHHKQTGRNPHSGDVYSPVENHDLVSSLLNNTTSHAHFQGA